MLEKHETEDEAREYLGEGFISKFEQILTALDRQETIVALHGTNEQVKKEQEEKYSMFNKNSESIKSIEQVYDFEDFDWEDNLGLGDDFDWRDDFEFEPLPDQSKKNK